MARDTLPDADPACLPVFQPHWWHRQDRLDARPVVWSLYNRPEDWEWKRYYGDVVSDAILVHKPSKHEFWVATGIGFYRLHDANCSCHRDTAGWFQRFQQYAFHRAFRHWRRTYDPQTRGLQLIKAQFASHFVY